MPESRLDREFYDQPTKVLAKRLLGKTLARSIGGTVLRGIIVEVEAYLSSKDPASHSFAGMGRKNRCMFGFSGSLYVYPIHSRHCCNVVTEGEGRGAAVLIRALEPIAEQERMWLHRFEEHRAESVVCRKEALKLTQGPGRLCEAMKIDREQDGTDLVEGNEVWIEEAYPMVRAQKWKRRSSPRIGISKAQSLPLRHFIDGNQFVSGLARDHSAGRNWTFSYDV